MSTIEVYFLRQSPELKFTLNQDNFQLIDNYNKNLSGPYNYNGIKSIKFLKKGTNWFTTIIAYIVSLSVGLESGGSMVFPESDEDGPTLKNRNRLIIKHETKRIDILLNDCPLKQTEELVTILKLRANLIQK